jgi:hypothetical protein
MAAAATGPPGTAADAPEQARISNAIESPATTRSTLIRLGSALPAGALLRKAPVAAALPAGALLREAGLRRVRPGEVLLGEAGLPLLCVWCKLTARLTI